MTRLIAGDEIKELVFEESKEPTAAEEASEKPAQNTIVAEEIEG